MIGKAARALSGFALCSLAAAFVAGRSGDPMLASAAGLRESLRPELRERVSLAFDDERRIEWHYVPREWPGVALGELAAAERERLDGLLASALSEQGLRKVRGVFALEERLYADSGRDAMRDPGRYFLALWGEPGEKEPWGWRLEGHHLALHFTLAPEGIAATPFFLGAHPAEIGAGPEQGLRVLGAEEDLARELLASLSDEERRLAVREDERPGDVVFGPGRDFPQFRPGGIPAAKLAQEKRVLLERLVREYVGNLRADLAARELARIDERGAGAIHFLWIGPTERGEPFYYRLHGPHFMIEHDVVGENHVHSLWRDIEDDFGADLLRRHRAGEAR